MVVLRSLKCSNTWLDKVVPLPLHRGQEVSLRRNFYRLGMLSEADAVRGISCDILSQVCFHSVSRFDTSQKMSICAKSVRNSAGVAVCAASCKLNSHSRSSPSKPRASHAARYVGYTILSARTMHHEFRDYYVAFGISVFWRKFCRNLSPRILPCIRSTYRTKVRALYALSFEYNIFANIVTTITKNISSVRNVTRIRH
ncbi:hypothetical protein Tco_0699444 [Tanacetum coccineum]